MATEIVAIDPLEKETATHSGTLAWKISWTQKHGGLQFMGWQRVGHDWATERLNDFTFPVSVLPEELSKTIGQINHPILGIPGWTYWIQEAVFIMMKTWTKHSGRYQFMDLFKDHLQWQAFIIACLFIYVILQAQRFVILVPYLYHTLWYHICTLLSVVSFFKKRTPLLKIFQMTVDSCIKILAK